MSWDRTYTHTIAVSIDVLTASIVWNDNDVCVSSLAGLALRAKRSGFLAWLGRLLNKIQANHCELSIAGDIARCQAAIKLLS